MSRPASRAGLTPSPTDPLPDTVAPRKRDAAFSANEREPQTSALLVQNDGGFSMSTTSKRRRSELQQAALEAARIQAAHRAGQKEAELLRLLSQDIPEQP